MLRIPENLTPHFVRDRNHGIATWCHAFKPPPLTSSRIPATNRILRNRNGPHNQTKVLSTSSSGTNTSRPATYTVPVGNSIAPESAAEKDSDRR